MKSSSCAPWVVRKRNVNSMRRTGSVALSITLFFPSPPRNDDASLVSRELHAREGHCRCALSLFLSLFCVYSWSLVINTTRRDRATALVKPRPPSGYLRTKCQTGVNRHRYREERSSPEYTYMYVMYTRTPIHMYIYMHRS